MNSLGEDDGLASPGSGLRSNARELPPIGKVNRKVYWAVFLGSLLALATMVNMVAHGALAIAIDEPTPVKVTASKLQLDHFSIRARFEDGVPLLITRADLEATDFVMTQRLNFPLLGIMTLTLRADHAEIHGLVTRTVAGPQHILHLNEPFETIDDATFQGATLTISR